MTAARTWKMPVLLILGSLLIQVPLGLVLAHAYDVPVFMSAGRLAATGANPYIPQDLPSIGYPPPWVLVLAGVYKLTFARVPSIFLYNLGIKLPSILCAVILALVVRAVLVRSGSAQKESNAAAALVLLNPLIVVSTAWGQLDMAVALCAFLALLLLSRGTLVLSAAVLALAVSLKPTALPLVPLCVMAARFAPAARRSRTPAPALSYAAVFTLSAAAFCILPFILFRWDPSVIFRGWNTHFTMAGGLSFMSFLELITGTAVLPSSLQLLGFLWVPVLAAAAILLRPASADLDELLDKGDRKSVV